MEPSPLARLEQGLAHAEQSHPVEFKATHELKQWVKRQLGIHRSGLSHFEPVDQQRKTIKKLKDDRHLPSLKEARWLAFGLSLPMDHAPCLLEDAEWFDLALEQINAWQHDPRRFRKCYQGLLHSYFSYDGSGWLANTRFSAIGQANWRTLQAYLQNHLAQIQAPQEALPPPDWVDCLLKHPDILSDQPVAALATSQASITPSQWIQRLAIPRGSWFSKIWALAPLHQALGQDDALFYQRLPELIALMDKHPELHDAALTAVLNRCGTLSAPEGTLRPHTGLREHCARHWGSPWLPTHQEQWRHISPEAFHLLKDWFKLELIELFFEQLSDDREMRQRKMAFWQKHFKRIDTLHLALGTLAMNAKEPAWVNLRQKAQGFTVDMLDINPRNNALIMAIGQHMAIELAGTSDDFCHYQFETPTRPLTLALKPAQGPSGFSSKALRESDQVSWVVHQDHLNSSGQVQSWENTFEDLLTGW